MTSREEALRDADVLLGRGQLTGARELLERLRKEIEDELGPSSQELIAPLWSLANAYGRGQDAPSEDLATSLRFGERAIGLMESSRIGGPRLALMLSIQAHRSAQQGLGEQALKLAMQVKALQAGSAAEAEATIEAAYIALEACGRPEEAISLAREGADLERAQNGTVEINTHFILASCLRQAPGRQAEARECMNELLARESRVGTGDDELKEVVRGWLREFA